MKAIYKGENFSIMTKKGKVKSFIKGHTYGIHTRVDKALWVVDDKNGLSKQYTRLEKMLKEWELLPKEDDTNK